LEFGRFYFTILPKLKVSLGNECSLLSRYRGLDGIWTKGAVKARPESEAEQIL
jgi:hypothetical protein